MPFSSGCPVDWASSRAAARRRARMARAIERMLPPPPPSRAALTLRALLRELGGILAGALWPACVMLAIALGAWSLCAGLILSGALP